MAQSPNNNTPTAFQAKQALARAQQAERRYQDDQKIAEQIQDPELKAQVLLDSEATRSRELARSNTVLEQTGNHVPVTPSASTSSSLELLPDTGNPLPPPSPNLELLPDTGNPLPPPSPNLELLPDTGNPLPPPNAARGPTPGGTRTENRNNTNSGATASAPQPSVSNSNNSNNNNTGSGIPQQVGGVKFNFQDNEFNQYDRVAYHFKLILINDQDANDPDVGRKIINNQIKKYIVCESGVTLGFNLTEVSITDVVSPNFRSRSNITTEINLKMIEPYGMTLPDRLYNASKELALPNWRIAPLFLELEFRYIKSDGTIYNPQGQQKLIKVYSLNIIEFDSQLSASGTVYDIKCVAKDNMGFRDFYQIMTKTHSVETISVGFPNNSVGGFFETLGKTITQRCAQERQNNLASTVVPPVMEYVFVVDPDLAKQEINYSELVSGRRTSFKGSPNGEITIARGISITALVDDILASLKDVEFFIADKNAGLIKIPRLECITENIGWDGLRKDYIRKFTFIIATKTSNRPIPYKQLAETLQSSAEKQQARLKILAENMKKAYEYWYTGKNTEILSLDVKFNQLHVIVEPALQTTLPPQLTDSVKVDTREDILKQKAQLEQEKKLWEKPTVDAVNPDTQLKETLRINEEIMRAEERLSDINRESIYLFDGNNTLASLLGLSTTPSQQQQQTITRLQNLRTNINNAAKIRSFVEDVSRQITDKNRLVPNWSTDPRDMQNTQTRAVAGTTSSNDPLTATRAIVSSILTQIYDRVGSQMLEIDMEICGDPYWLGKTDVERSTELRGYINKIQNTQAITNNLGTTNTNTNSNEIVNIYDTDATILLKFRAGGQPSSDTGLPNLDQESDFFYGIYTVLEIVHEFKEGKFTQRIKAMRDILIDISAIRAADKQATSSTQPNQIASVVPSAQPPGSGAASNANVNASVVTPPLTPAQVELRRLNTVISEQVSQL